MAESLNHDPYLESRDFIVSHVHSHGYWSPIDKSVTITKYNDFQINMPIKRPISREKKEEKIDVYCQYCNKNISLYVNSDPFVFSSINDLCSSSNQAKIRIAKILSQYWGFLFMWWFFIVGEICGAIYLINSGAIKIVRLPHIAISYYTVIIVSSIVYLIFYGIYVKKSLKKYINNKKFKQPILCSLKYRTKKKININYSEQFNFVTSVIVGTEHHYIFMPNKDLSRWARSVNVGIQISEYLKKQNIRIMGED